MSRKGWSLAAHLLAKQPKHLRAPLADALEAGFLDLRSSVISVTSHLPMEPGEASTTVRLLAAWHELGLSAETAAAWLRSLDRQEMSFVSPQFVWSGPEVPGLHARDTRRVFEELICDASRSLWISTYAFFEGPKAFRSLAERLDTQPDLDATMLLNVQRKPGDTSTEESLVHRFADRFWTKEWPGAKRPDVFYDPRSIVPGRPDGVLHAKSIVADESITLVTSANSTEAALDRNIEMGLLYRDRHLAMTVVRHFRTLISRGLLLRLPTPT